LSREFGMPANGRIEPNEARHHCIHDRDVGVQPSGPVHRFVAIRCLPKCSTKSLGVFAPLRDTARAYETLSPRPPVAYKANRRENPYARFELRLLVH